jgi:hypothetical protein
MKGIFFLSIGVLAGEMLAFFYRLFFVTGYGAIVEIERNPFPIFYGAIVLLVSALLSYVTAPHSTHSVSQSSITFIRLWISVLISWLPIPLIYGFALYVKPVDTAGLFYFLLIWIFVALAVIYHIIIFTRVSIKHTFAKAIGPIVGVLVFYVILILSLIAVADFINFRI